MIEINQQNNNQTSIFTTVMHLDVQRLGCMWRLHKALFKGHESSWRLLLQVHIIIKRNRWFYRCRIGIRVLFYAHELKRPLSNLYTITCRPSVFYIFQSAIFWFCFDDTLPFLVLDSLQLMFVSYLSQQETKTWHMSLVIFSHVIV